VIKAAEDSALQYMNFMNVIFAAQKQNILIDACVLDSDSGLLQQVRVQWRCGGGGLGSMVCSLYC